MSGGCVLHPQILRGSHNSSVETSLIEIQLINYHHDRTLKLCFTGSFECATNLVITGICGQNMNSFAMQTVIAHFNSLPIPCSFEEETLLALVEDLQVYLFRQRIDLYATTNTSTYCSAANRFIPSSKIPVTLSFK